MCDASDFYFTESQQCPSTATREWVLTDTADSKQLGSVERMKVKVGLIRATRTVAAAGDERSKRRVEEAEQRAREAGGRAMGAEGRAREAEGRVREAESRVGEAEGRARDAEGRVREAESRVGEAEGRAREAEQRAMEAEETSENRKLESEQRLAESEQRLVESEQRLMESEQNLVQSEERLQQLETQWVVERREIQLTDQELGRGGWATVSVAMFRGARVAAKCIHGEIASDYNIQLFTREINVAARIRHPNLLQFIGAALEGEMVILTELMPTSLRNELKKQPMSNNQATGISLDVARALNYLHLMQPHPLVHRDISSANVLLELLPNECWKAKVSDYGTVHLQQMLSTICPGNPCYAAPEANDPTQQTPKMDIFSFGVLLMEMLAGEFPDNRPRLLRKIRHQPLMNLIQRCLKERKQDRPSASDIISELDP